MSLMPGHRHLLQTSVLVFLTFQVSADTYFIPPDYAVACLDAETGEMLWETRPPELERPLITAAGDQVIAEGERVIDPTPEELEKWRAEGGSLETYGELFRRERRTLVFDADGELLDSEPIPTAERVGPLEALGRNLVAGDGTVFVFDSGNTRHLEARTQQGTRIVRELPGYPHDLQVAGDLVIFSLAGNNGGLRGGEVFAYDLEQGALRWQFESWRHAGAPRHRLTDVAVDGDRVLVAVDQVIFSLDLETGALIWSTALPRQQIRDWSNPWTRFGHLGHRLFVACYEDLFVLDRDAGELRWSFDPGPFGEAWPTISGGRVYVATRQTAAELASTSIGGEPGIEPPPSLVRISSDRSGDERFVVDLVTTDALPADTVAWSPLSAVPAPRRDSGSIRVELIEGPPAERVSSVEIGGILEQQGVAYVKLFDFIDRISVRSGKTRVAELVIRAYPSEWQSTPTSIRVFGLVVLFLLATAVVATMLSLPAWRASIALFRFPSLAKPYRRSAVLTNLTEFLSMMALGLIGLGIIYPVMYYLSPEQFVMAATATIGVAWCCTMLARNWFCLLGNHRLRLATRDAMADMELPAESIFAGIFEPDRKTVFNQLVDTHDDFGFLYLTDQVLIFEGSRTRRELPLSSIVSLSTPIIWQFWIHGARWLEILYRLDGEARRLRVESRERGTLWANTRATKKLGGRLAGRLQNPYSSRNEGTQ